MRLVNEQQAETLQENKELVSRLTEENMSVLETVDSKSKSINSFVEPLLRLMDTYAETTSAADNSDIDSMIQDIVRFVAKLHDDLVLNRVQGDGLNSEKEELTNKVALLAEALAASEALVVECKEEIKNIKEERDSQMMAVAKLVTKKATLEGEVEQCSKAKFALVKERDEAVVRCTSLRSMNEELLQMLEQVKGI